MCFGLMAMLDGLEELQYDRPPLLARSINVWPKVPDIGYEGSADQCTQQSALAACLQLSF